MWELTIHSREDIDWVGLYDVDFNPSKGLCQVVEEEGEAIRSSRSVFLPPPRIVRDVLELNSTYPGMGKVISFFPLFFHNFYRLFISLFLTLTLSLSPSLPQYQTYFNRMPFILIPAFEVLSTLIPPTLLLTPFFISPSPALPVHFWPLLNAQNQKRSRKNGGR